MIVIDGKAHRNMPEQVAKNQKDIEDIFNTLDGLNIQDNVVAIADLSHIMTQDELEIVERAVAFIVYNNHLFIKRDQDATNAYFDIVFSISGTTVISFNSDEMQVNLTTGALNLVSNTYQTYSKTELDTQLNAKASTTYVDTQLALKANLNGANFTGAITAPSIIEDMSGYSFTKASSTADYNISYSYVGIVKNGNKITFVMAGTITKLATYTGQLTLGKFIFPNTIGNALQPYSLSPFNDILENKKIAFWSNYNTAIEEPCLSRKDSSTQFGPITYINDLVQNTPYIFRYEATFLLSNNLAS